MTDGGDSLFFPISRSETGSIPSQLGRRFQGTAFRFVFLHLIKFKCALRQSVDLWPRAVFAQLESLSDLFWIFPYLCASGSVVPLHRAVCAGDREKRFQAARIPAPLLPDPSHGLLCVRSGIREGGDLPHRIVWKSESTASVRRGQMKQRLSGRTCV